MNCHTNNNGVLGNSIDIKVDPCNPAVEIRADVKVEEFNTKRIWGQIINCHGMPVPNTLIKLVKVEKQGCHSKYFGIAHTVTDCEGFYQFDVCSDDEESCYKIIVNKAVTGPEAVVETGGGNCNACGIMTNPKNGMSSYNPCAMPHQIKMPYMPCDTGRNSQGCHAQTMPCEQEYMQCAPCVDTMPYQPCHSPKDDGCYSKKSCNKTNYASYTR